MTLGRPFAVSINFDPEIISKALNDNRGPLNYLRRQVLRHFKRALLARPCWIKVETTKLGKVHVHMGMALRDSDDPQVFKVIAAQSGGDYTTQGSAPADVRWMWGPDGWVNYVNKDDARTRRHLREALGLEPEDRVPLYSATDDIRALAKELHQEARRAAQEARGRPNAVEVPPDYPGSRGTCQRVSGRAGFPFEVSKQACFDADDAAPYPGRRDPRAGDRARRDLEGVDRDLGRASGLSGSSE